MSLVVLESLFAIGLAAPAGFLRQQRRDRIYMVEEARQQLSGMEMQQAGVGGLVEGLGRAGRAVVRWLGLAPKDVLLPRKYCHLIDIRLRGVPRKHVESAIRLQLRQLDLYPQIGFAYRLEGDTAWVWYWNDARVREIYADGQVMPWPEPLWRTSLTGGGHLVVCSSGYELEGRGGGGVYRSRWFAELPAQEDWQAFCRDLGNETGAICPEPVRLPLLSRPAAGWKVHSENVSSLPLYGWLVIAMIVVAGTLGAVQWAQIQRLRDGSAAVGLELRQLKRLNAETELLEKQLSTLKPLVGTLRDAARQPKQLQMMAALASAGVVGEAAGMYIQGWSYQSDALMLTVSLTEKVKPAQLLERLERTGLYEEISLLPDPPQGAVVVRLKLSNEGGATIAQWAGIQAKSGPPAR